MLSRLAIRGRRGLIRLQHAKRKRILADRYANSNVMKPIVLSGIEKRAEEFVKQCMDTAKNTVDVYVITKSANPGNYPSDLSLTYFSAL